MKKLFVIFALLLLCSGIYVATAAETYVYTTQWNTSASGDTVSSYPNSIATDSAGNVYVIDLFNNRIKKFTSTGGFILGWGSSGTGDGQFNQPNGVTVDSAGNVYVADYGNYRIQKFTSTGTFVMKWGSQGSGDGQFNLPSGVAVDSAGNVYVSDTNNNRIQKFTSTGTFVMKWGSPGTTSGTFASPRGIAVDSADSVYVADGNNFRVQKFTSTGTFITKWGSYGTSANSTFQYLWGIAVDSAGKVYVVDRDNNRIQKFTSTGTFLTKWGSYGSGNGQFWVPRDVAVDNAGNVYVADMNNHRIQKFRQAVLPVAAFTVNATSGKAPLSVAFTDTSTGSPTSWNWTFGDGTNSSVHNPVHTYTVPGTYTVILNVTNVDGTNSVTKTDLITVSPLAPPVANFTVNATTGKVPLTVGFTDTSTNTPTSWAWTFGDSGTSTEQNPTHTYTIPGTYPVTLNVMNADGTNSVTKTDLITVSPLAPPVAGFTANTTSGKVPLTVAFTDASTNTPTSWSWSFGDSSTSTEQSPVHTYAAAGTFTVTLNVMNTDGSDSVTKTNLITVSALAPPVANFTVNATTGKAPLTVGFTDTSTNAPTGWIWSFGDSSTSTEQNPVHTYTVPGTYTVNLTVTNTDGTNSIKKTNLITVTASVQVKPIAKFDVNATVGPAPLALQFTDRSTRSPTSWEWTFDDGTRSSDRNPIHVFTQPGTYTVSLKVTNSAGSHTAKKKITVQRPVVDAKFTTDVTTGKAPLTVRFTDLSTGNPTFWLWSFGDGSFSNSKNPSHTYQRKGTYSVLLYVFNGWDADTVYSARLITVR